MYYSHRVLLYSANGMSQARPRIRPSIGFLCGLALAVIFGIAFFFRVYFPYHHVFAGDWVAYQETDCWYHMRQVTNLVQHFPDRMLFDPFGFYPGGQPIASAPFVDMSLGFFVWLFGAGSPSTHLMETVGAYFPAVLGALITVPVYVIGKEMFGRVAGLLAAALVAILPGDFIWRSELGFPDHHVVESFLSVLAVMFLVLALKSAKRNGVSFSSLKDRAWGTLRRPLVYSVLAGIVLGCYLLSWTGGALFVFIIFVFFVLQYVIDHVRGRSTDYLCIAGLPLLVIALIMVSPISGQYSLGNLQVASLAIGIVTLLALSAISYLMAKRNVRVAYYPMALLIMGVIGFVLFYVADRPLLDAILSKLNVLNPAGGSLTISEVKPLSISSAWEQFTTAFYLSVISLVIVFYRVIREGASDKTLLLVWSVVMLVATIGQHRFAYYFAVNAAILTGYLSWEILTFPIMARGAGESRPEEAPASVPRKAKDKAKRAKQAKRRKEKAPQPALGTMLRRSLKVRYAYIVVALIVIFFLVYYPNIGEAKNWVSADTGPGEDWHESLVWLGNSTNTPEPFPDPNSYYERYVPPAPGQAYEYPSSAYGVMSWWDYGYWITYIAHRIPNASPGGQRGAHDAGLFFTATDESSANEILDRLGSRYVIVDLDMAVGKYYAMAEWAGKPQDQFYDVYYEKGTDMYSPLVVYYPAFYQSMCIRLYVLRGKEWVPQETTVVSWRASNLVDSEGNTIEAKVVTDKKSFSRYADALAFVETNPSYTIVGTNRLLSPVPLEKLDHYTLVHSSPNPGVQWGDDTISRVLVFKYGP